MQKRKVSSSSKKHSELIRKLKQEKSGNALPYGLYYDPKFIVPKTREEILSYLKTIHPIWEQRFSESNPPPKGQEQRWLLRPVYWLGNWQFACLDYYHPPKGILNRCVDAEKFPPVLQKIVDEIERIVKRDFRPQDVPDGWHLNTCLINYYGSKIETGADGSKKRIDTARVGEHKDFEPGPVGSISLGERAFFQFVKSERIGERDGVEYQQWLEDGSLQIFGGERFKSKLFHRVQRVDKKTKVVFEHLNTTDFETRRINFTFRYVPLEHYVKFHDLPLEKKKDISPYIAELSKHSDFFKKL